MTLRADEAEDSGIQLRDAGHLSRAEQKFRLAVDLTGTSLQESAVRARRSMLLGEVLSVLDRYTEADALYTDALEERGAEPHVRLNTLRLRSALLLTQGRLADARQAIDQALKRTTIQSSRLEDLDARLQHAYVTQAEGRFDAEARRAVDDLIENYAARQDTAGARGQGYCRLLLARAAVARNNFVDALDITNEVLRAAEGTPALYRLVAQAHHVAGEAHLAAAQFDAALDAFERCAEACLWQGEALPELRRIYVDAQLGIATVERVRGDVDMGDGRLLRLAATIAQLRDEDAVPLQAKYWLARGLSHIQQAAGAGLAERRAQLGLARSHLRTADLLRRRVDGTARIGIQISVALAFVQRTLGRPGQAALTLQAAQPLSDSPAVGASDRGDFLVGVASTYLRGTPDSAALDAAAKLLSDARGTYRSWYDLARVDQNLALIDVQRADITQSLGAHADEQRHLESALELLVPALLAKFAVRFTLMSPRLRRFWNAQQAHGFEVAVDCAVRLHALQPVQVAAPSAATVSATQLVADLVLVSRIQGVLTPTDAMLPVGFESLADPAELPIRPFVDNPAGTGISPAVADVIGIGDEPSLLAPTPQLVAPDGRVVLARHFARAIDLYQLHGLPVGRLYRPGHRMRL